MTRALAWGLVAAQFVLIAVLVFLPHGSLVPPGPPRLVAIAVAATLGVAALVILGISLRGLGASLTPSPVPRKDAALVTSGLYAWVRHPIYSALLLGGLALALVGASVWHIAGWLALFALLSVKARWEERMLLAEHAAYADYAAAVGRFIPGVGRIRA